MKTERSEKKTAVGIYPFNSVAQQSLNEQLNTYQCRICLQEDHFGAVFSPCICQSKVHSSCLQFWLQRKYKSKDKKKAKCQVCLQKFDIEWRESYKVSCEKFEKRKNSQIIFFYIKVFFIIIFLGLSVMGGLLVLDILPQIKMDLSTNFQIGFQGILIGSSTMFFATFFYLTLKFICDYFVVRVSKIEI